MENNPLMPGVVVIAYDATKDRSERELKLTIDNVQVRGDILHAGDTITLLGVLHKVPHPLGYQMQPRPESFMGMNVRAMEEEVSKKVDMYVNMLLQSAEDCKDEGVDIEVKITAGTPIKKVVLQEVTTCNATWVILDRHLRRDLRFYLKQIPCKVALIQDNLSVEVLRPYNTADTDNIEHNLFFSMSNPVPLSTGQDKENIEQSVTSCGSYPASISSLESSDMLKNNLASSFTYRSQEHSFSARDDSGSNSKQEKSGRYTEGENKYPTALQIIQKQHQNPRRQRSSDAPVLCAACGIKTQLYIKDSMRFSFSEIQLATDDFSKKNLLGEGGYGLVYIGKLNDGQLIAAKVRKEESTQGFTEFHSEVYVLSFARHKNIVMLLGYCCKENLNILVYEYICNKSLEWHLFDKTENVLEWHQRHAIAIGTAKGLRFLHEECRGSPIIHRDMRPSNILLTHDFVPMLGDFGLAKWKTSDDPVDKRILGTLGYLAPEYIENGIVSVRTDVYAFGIVLIQLISGHKVVDSKREDQRESLRQWAEPLIVRLALHELIDPRLGESYDTYELYHMARTAYLCVQSNPEMRPSMGQVVHILEGENDHLHHLAEQFIPHFTK
uniref:Protein kinase domain-containing protein n=1 Tax=Davidia involucrata TaxID=16924 RepID=A0A5B6YNP9_DAVIN